LLSASDGPGASPGVDGSASTTDHAGDAGATYGADGSDGSATCATLGLHVDTFASGLKKTGRAGLFAFELVSSDPSPPNDPQMNTWLIRVLDASGSPVTGATVVLPANDTALGWSAPKNPWMPTMNHGSSIANTITNNGDGTASLQISFTMSGLWAVLLQRCRYFRPPSSCRRNSWSRPSPPASW
jgi:hypothetical protein